MRRVLRNASEVFHVWANRGQSEGRCGNVSFNGDVLYSYSAPIARHFCNASGERCVLHSARRYSVTTSGHQSRARRASSHIKPFYFHDLLHFAAPESYVSAMRSHAETIREDISRHRLARTRAATWMEYRSALESANEFAAFFGLPETELPPEDNSAEGKAAYVAHAAAEKQRKADAAKRAAARHAEALERLESWRNGGPNDCLWNLNFDAMRIVGDNVETTRGVSVPVEHVARSADRVLFACRAAVESGKAWYPPNDSAPIRFAFYQLARIERDGTVCVGCHRFPLSEIERLASSLTPEAVNA